MGIVKRVDPTNKDFLKYLYAMDGEIRDEEFQITFDRFMQCRNDMYIYTDNCDICEYQYPIINGIIGCMRTNIEDIDIECLGYYPQPYHILYSIEVFNIMSNIDQWSKEFKEEVTKALLNTIAVDKNDAFIAIKVFCKYGVPDWDIIEAIKECGYSFNSYGNFTFTYVKAPTTRINRNA